MSHVLGEGIWDGYNQDTLYTSTNPQKVTKYYSFFY